MVLSGCADPEQAILHLSDRIAGGLGNALKLSFNDGCGLALTLTLELDEHCEIQRPRRLRRVMRYKRVLCK